MNRLTRSLRASLFTLGLAVWGVTWAGEARADHHHADHHHAAAHVVEGDTHAAHAHEDHVPTFAEINWWFGWLGEKEGATPGLLWRAPGTPPPLSATILNTAIVFFLLGRILGPTIKGGLASRKKRIAGDIEAATAMKAEAEEQLAYYEGRLREMEAEMERIKAEMSAQAQAERQRILEEAQVRRVSLEQEARKLVAHELSAAREKIAKAAAAQAVESARALLLSSVGPQDQDRLAQELLGSLEHYVKGSRS